MTEAIRMYKLVPPHGRLFYAAIVPWRDGVAVISTRDGDWARDKALHAADLIQPEQKLGNWDVERNPDDAPDIPDDMPAA